MEELTLADHFATWGPLVLLLVVFLVWGRSAQSKYKQHVDDVNAVNQQIVDTNREMIAELKEIKQILKDQT
ncbi:MAG: hypothetical protein KI785_06730 [Devosiaceae bacterium]|nr:hypothetical protein [Devosiaceae bacterium MH13]